jgi:hypothetical protein
MVPQILRNFDDAGPTASVGHYDCGGFSQLPQCSRKALPNNFYVRPKRGHLVGLSREGEVVVFGFDDHGDRLVLQGAGAPLPGLKANGVTDAPHLFGAFPKWRDNPREGRWVFAGRDPTQSIPPHREDRVSVDD